MTCPDARPPPAFALGDVDCIALERASRARSPGYGDAVDDLVGHLAEVDLRRRLRADELRAQLNEEVSA